MIIRSTHRTPGSQKRLLVGFCGLGCENVTRDMGACAKAPYSRTEREGIAENAEIIDFSEPEPQYEVSTGTEND